MAAVCSCRRARQALRRLERANIPRRHEHATLENYESVETTGSHETMLQAHFKAHQFVLDYPHNTDGRGLMFVGMAGRGKTHLAAAICRQTNACCALGLRTLWLSSITTSPVSSVSSSGGPYRYWCAAKTMSAVFAAAFCF